MQIAEELLKGNRRALARAISLIENDAEEKKEILSGIFAHTGQAYVVGVTGSPGAGKSSLVNRLTQEIRRWGLTVGIIAIDPTSPFSGGALLGDRIRMQDHVLDEGVFIRSMGTRGSLGGLARATKDAIKVLDAFGMDIVLVETVGVGQSELDVMHAVDTTVVVLTPGAGDVIQTLKAGIMEIADVFAVNKADLDGADRVAREVESMLDLDQKREWRPPVVMTTTIDGFGIEELYKAVNGHRSFLEQKNYLEKIRGKRLRSEVVDIILEKMKAKIDLQFSGSHGFEEMLQRVVDRQLDTYTAAEEVLQKLAGS